MIPQQYLDLLNAAQTKLDEKKAADVTLQKAKDALAAATSAAAKADSDLAASMAALGVSSKAALDALTDYFKG